MMSVDDDAADRAFLLDALRAHPGERFSAARLQLRGVPKMQVRRLLTGIEGVTISEERDGLWFSWTGAPR
jgi:hypothetical protein